jgi:hypothetical protein
MRTWQVLVYFELDVSSFALTILLLLLALLCYVTQTLQLPLRHSQGAVNKNTDSV